MLKSHIRPVVTVLDRTGVNYGWETAKVPVLEYSMDNHSFRKFRIWQQQEHSHGTIFQLLLLISDSKLILSSQYCQENLSSFRGNLETTGLRECKSKLEKVVAGQGAAVKGATSFQQMLPSLNSLNVLQCFWLSACVGEFLYCHSMQLESRIRSDWWANTEARWIAHQPSQPMTHSSI